MIAILFLLLFGALAYRRDSALIWSVVMGAFLLIATYTTDAGITLALLWGIYGVIATLSLIAPLRRVLLSGAVLNAFKKVLPPMSRTEKEALDAGTVWFDGDLFSGNPDWNKLLKHNTARLTAEEQAFIDGPVNQLCEMINDWEISQIDNDLPPEAWQFIKDSGLFGMIIPKKYGGLEFSAIAHSAVVMKISTRSVAAAVTVMVPNSLGPAELLLRYGTDEQKEYYLPRLAKGEEIPCFALTGPEAGSDAGSIPDFGIVCKQDFDGQKDVLGIRVTWNKRYITLGPVATVLGLAFQLQDPDNILEDKYETGITCALIPTSHPGVIIGRRHHPSGIGFQNGPNSGDDVFIPMDWVIGGLPQVGQGWRMLMECLAAGRTISLPALSVGGAKFTGRAIGAYARIRKQFKMPIGFFEGVEEPLARAAGHAYMMDAARKLTASALDQGESPSVLSAVLKYNLTERMRISVNDAMDVQGGAGICLGPNNILGKLYHAIPISITVEGANILTRTLIVFGQGAIRCHPYVFKEMQAATETNAKKALVDFDNAFAGHLYFSTSNFFRSLFMGLTNASFVNVPENAKLQRYYQQVTRFSSAFALLTDISMLIYGGGLKRKEKLSGRFADTLSCMYLISSSLKQFNDDGCPDEDFPVLQWVCEDNLYRIQGSMAGIIQNMPNPIVRKALSLIIFPLGKRLKPPTDSLGQSLASILLKPSATRDRLTAGIYLPKTDDQQVGRLEIAFEMAEEADKIERRLNGLKRNGEINGENIDALLKQADKKSLITDEEAKMFSRFLELRKLIISVDDFDKDEFRLNKVG
ncbi:MAG: acyl-CoA dehydrogenase [Gammaproteobacteria bacterium]|nr:acyl-CoA dehydrogenase [Gammaproteobacteria bacterium]